MRKPQRTHSFRWGFCLTQSRDREQEIVLFFSFLGFS